MTKPMARVDIIRQIAASGRIGSLGFFIGSGFGKALTGDKAPDWRGLLADVAKALGLQDPYRDSLANIGRSFPSVAYGLVEELVQKLRRGKPFEKADDTTLRTEAAALLKMEIARKSNSVADEGMRIRAHDAFAKIQPSWFITTNYDFLIEQVVDDHDSLLPQQVLLPQRKVTPIFHLHGHLHSPATIVITEEDYAQLLPRLDYRFAKLSLLLAESTTVLIGYSLNDINVQTAVQLARALSPISKELHSPNQGRLVLVEWSHGKPPAREPRLGRYGEHIIQAADIVGFLEEVCGVRGELDVAWDEALARIASLGTRLDFNKAFVEDAGVRKGIISSLTAIPGALAGNETAELLQKAFGEVAARAWDGKEGFPLYGNWLNALLDVFEQWRVGSMSPLVFAVLARHLGAVLPSVYETDEEVVGYSWAATHTWHARKRSLVEQADLYEHLLAFAEREGELVMLRRLAGCG